MAERKPGMDEVKEMEKICFREEGGSVVMNIQLK